MRRRLLGTAFGLALSLAIAGTAFADSCLNLSRAAPACHPTCEGPVIDGNWAWLPSIGVPVEAWGFAAPGGEESINNGLPAANGNYQNGFSESLLGHSAYCLKGVNQEKSHGIVSGCL